MDHGIEASTVVRVPLARVRQVLADDPGRVVADQMAPGDRDERRFASVLAVELRAGGTVRQTVTVRVGPPGPRRDGSAAFPLRLRASGHANGQGRLFPTFDGEVVAEAAGPDATRLTVRGTCAIRPGPAERFGDGVVGRRLARQSVVSFVEDVASRLVRENTVRDSPRSVGPTIVPAVTGDRTAPQQC